MWRRLWSWINERWPAAAFLRTLAAEEIPGGATVKFSFGACVLLTFVLQVLTGLWQLFFYAPTVDHAYSSVSYLRTQVPFGWLIHNLHVWGATAMVVLLLIHMIRVFVWGAYKNPRQLTWLLGSTLFLLTMLMMFAGPSLPWDGKGYWTTEVGTSIAGTAPLVGDWLKRLLRGGEALGQATLSRFFVLHVAIIPLLIATIIVLHLVSFRRFGSAGPWRAEKRLSSGPFWPDQVAKDVIVYSLVFFTLIALSVFAPPPFHGPADPLDATYAPKPEWTFLFLYQVLKFFPGRLEAVGTVGVPLLIIGLLVSAPFLDRRKERNPAKRPLAMAVFFGVLAAAAALSFMGAAGSPESRSVAPDSAAASSPSSGPPAPPAAPEGAKIFQAAGCLVCHKVEGTGGTTGPDLSGEGLRGRSPEWLTEQIRDPKSHFPNTVMPPFKSLEDREVAALVDYLESLKSPSESKPGPSSEPGEDREKTAPPGIAAGFIGNARHGGDLYRLDCVDCHGPEGKGGVPNPGSEDGTVPSLNPIEAEFVDTDPKVFAARIDPYLQVGATPPGPNPALKMPGFGVSLSLTQEQISHLEAYVLSLNGVSRESIARPGLRPATFFILAAAVSGASFLAFTGVWIGIARRSRRRPPGA
jgi:ubiquinol-cytochrome c reductase cytochrome b subunit